MLSLRSADDIKKQVSIETFNAVDHTRQVACCVVESALTFLHDERQRVAFTIGIARWENNVGTIGLLQKTKLVETRNDLWQEIVLRALAHEVVIG